MLELISILMIFLLDSAPSGIDSGFLIMPFITYLAYTKEKSILFYFIILSTILALQSVEPIVAFIFVGINLVCYYIFFIIFDYDVESIVPITVAQMIGWAIFLGRFEFKFSLSLKLIIFLVINYMYMRRTVK